MFANLGRLERTIELGDQFERLGANLRLQIADAVRACADRGQADGIGGRKSGRRSMGVGRSSRKIKSIRAFGSSNDAVIASFNASEHVEQHPPVQQL